MRLNGRCLICFRQSGDRDEWPGWSCRMKTSPLRLKMTGRDSIRSCIIRYVRRHVHYPMVPSSVSASIMDFSCLQKILYRGILMT